MGKIYTALGLMSGTSMDGVDASIIQTDGKSKYKSILDKYFEYPKTIYNNLTTLRDKIKSSKDLKKHQKQIKSVEKEITIFHAKAVNQILKKTKPDEKEIVFVSKKLSINEEMRAFDTSTGFQTGHISQSRSTNWEIEFSTNEKKILNDTFKDWLLKFKY